MRLAHAGDQSKTKAEMIGEVLSYRIKKLDAVIRPLGKVCKVLIELRP